MEAFFFMIIITAALISGFIYCNIGFNEAQVDSHVGKPNFIIILADDIGWGDLGANWPLTKETPNLDKMVQGGMRYGCCGREDGRGERKDARVEKMLEGGCWVVNNSIF